MSQEKVDVLRGLGAEIVRTPTEAAFDSPESHCGVAARLNKEIPNSHILDQYSNTGNALAHYDGTAEEILEACDGKVDMLVISAGTGGTIAGIARKFKEKLPSCKIVGVDPYGSLLAQPEELNVTDITTYAVEGIGYDFIPRVLDRSVVDSWVKTADKESLLMARRLIREEGLLCGGSGGATVWAACQAAKDLKEGQRVVVILADSVRNYMTKFLNDDWMHERGFIDKSSSQLDIATGEWWFNLPVSQLPQKAPFTVNPDVPVSTAVDIMQREGIDQIPVISASGDILGVLTESKLMSSLIRNKATPSDPVEKFLYKQFKKVDTSAKLGDISRMLDRDHFVLITSTQRCYQSDGSVSDKTTIFSIVTRIDLLNFITRKAEAK